MSAGKQTLEERLIRIETRLVKYQQETTIKVSELQESINRMEKTLKGSRRGQSSTKATDG